MNLFLIVLYLYVCIYLFLGNSFTDKQEQLTGRMFPQLLTLVMQENCYQKCLQLLTWRNPMQISKQVSVWLVYFSETTQITQSSNSKDWKSREVSGAQSRRHFPFLTLRSLPSALICTCRQRFLVIGIWARSPSPPYDKTANWGFLMGVGEITLTEQECVLVPLKRGCDSDKCARCGAEV